MQFSPRLLKKFSRSLNFSCTNRKFSFSSHVFKYYTPTEMPEYVKQRGMSACRPFLIGVCGGTASGKSTVCEEINKRVLGDRRSSLVATICQDSFYRGLTEEEKRKAFAGDFNFDHPDAIDHQLMLQILKDLKASKPVKIPKYDYRLHCRSSEETTVEPADVVLVEGILIFYYQEIRNMFDMKLFVDTDPDTRLARRVQRDLNERGRTLQNILHQYLTLVKPAYEEFCLPTKKYADVIIPRGAENTVAIDLIVQHIQEILRGCSSSSKSADSSVPIPSGLRNSLESLRPTNRPH